MIRKDQLFFTKSTSGQIDWLKPQRFAVVLELCLGSEYYEYDDKYIIQTKHKIIFENKTKKVKGQGVKLGSVRLPETNNFFGGALGLWLESG